MIKDAKKDLELFYLASRFMFCVPKLAWKRDTKWVINIVVKTKF